MQPSRKPETATRKLVSGLMLAFLTLSLSACETMKPQPTKKAQRETPPSVWLQLTPLPVWPATMINADLLDFVRLHRRQLNACNSDKSDILEWAK